MSPAKTSKRGASSKAKDGTRGIFREREPLEIAVLAISLLAIGGVLAALLMAEGTIANGPPDLRATVTPVTTQRSGGTAFEVRVRNTGGRTAENVVVDVTVGSATRTLNLTAVARGDEEVGVVVFAPHTTGDPNAEVVSYSEPAR